MKRLIFVAAMAFAPAAFAQGVVVKECTTAVKKLESNGTVGMTLKVVSANDNSLSAVVIQTVDGATSSYTDIASVSEGAVRPNLSSDSEVDDLNQAEGLVVHAMSVSENPIFKGAYTPGIDLKKVRSAKLYTIGETTNMGAAVIVEARDENQQVLGSFLGGFFVSPCR